MFDSFESSPMGRTIHEPAGVAEPLSRGAGSGIAPKAGAGVLTESRSTRALAAMTTPERNDRPEQLFGAQSAALLTNRGLG